MKARSLTVLSAMAASFLSIGCTPNSLDAKAGVEGGDIVVNRPPTRHDKPREPSGRVYRGDGELSSQ